MSRRSHTRVIRPPGRVAFAAVALLGALSLLAGCGSDSASGGSGGDKPTLRLAYQAFPSGDLIVKDQKWLEASLPGWNIKWSKFDSGADINTAFIGKSIDIAAIGSSPVARGLSAPLNIPYKVVWVLDVAGDNEALVVRNGSGITSIAGLKGKKVGTPFASTSHYSLLAALAANNIPESSVKLLDLQPPDIQSAWTRGDIDAAYVWLPALAELQKSGKTLITSRELAAQGKATLDLGVATSDLVAKHPEVLKAWRAAEAKALNLIKSDPAASSAAVGRQLGITPEEAATQLKAGIFLTPAEQSDPKWLGKEGAVGGLANNLFDAAAFLKAQQKVDSAPPLTTFQNGSSSRDSPMSPAPEPRGGRLEASTVGHRFGNGRNQVTALQGIDFVVPSGEFLVLVGPSGCGKSTLLRLIAGFETPTEGTIRVDGEQPTPGVQAGQVFQAPRLFPWRTVGGNVELALRYAGVPRAERRARAEHLLEQVGLTGVYQRRIWEISGGQQQRVAIARANARQAPLFLLDEPFAALDALTRERLQEDVRALSHELGTTTVFVTHSVDEAVFLASRVMVMGSKPGRVILDLPVDLPRTGIGAEELRALPEYATLRTEIAHAVRTTPSPLIPTQ